MVKEKTKVTVIISTVLELDGVDSMEKIVVEDSMEFTSIKSFLRFFAELWKKFIQVNFRFL